MFWKKIFKRKTFVVDKKFQYQIASYFTGLYFIILTLLYINLRWYLTSGSIEFSRIFSLSAEATSEFDIYMVDVLNWFFIVFGGTGMVVIMAGGLVITNRAAGPIGKLLNYLREKNLGENPKPIEFRKKDFFGELKDEVDKTISMLEKK